MFLIKSNPVQQTCFKKIKNNPVQQPVVPKLQVETNQILKHVFFKLVPWRNSISRPIAPIYSVAGGMDNTTYIDHAARVF
jgi:hypothetical protein